VTVPIVVIVALAALYSIYCIPFFHASECMQRGQVHISALLNNPVFYECGVALAMALCVMSVNIGLEMHQNMREMKKQGAQHEAVLATAIIALHISFAPLIMGTAVTVLDEENSKHVCLAMMMFISSVLLVLCYAIEAYQQGWTPGLLTLMALVIVGTVMAHIPSGIRQIMDRNHGTHDVAYVEVFLIIALSMIYIDTVPFVFDKIAN
jgi:cation transport ATPase